MSWNLNSILLVTAILLAVVSLILVLRASK